MNPSAPTLAHIPVKGCVPHEANRTISDADVTEMADSIRTVGLLSPISVRKLGDSFEIISGETRWRAHKRIGTETIAAFVYDKCDDVTVDTLRIVENEQRVPVTALQTARELRRLKNLHGLTHEAVAKRTSIPIDRVKRYLAIFNASDDVLDAIGKHNLSMKTALSLVRYERALGEAKARKVVRQVAAGELTSRDLDTLRKRGSGKKASAAGQDTADPWSKVEVTLRRFLSDDPDRGRALLERLAREALPPRKTKKATTARS